MKQILGTLIALAAALVPQAHAVHPHLANLRIEITNQQAIVNNTEPLDKKLATALRSSLTKMSNAGPVDPVKASTALAAVTKTLSKSSLSNVFGPVLQGSVDSFINDLNADALDYANRLGTTIPSSKRTAAEKKVDLLEAQAAGADTNENVVAAAKLVSKAVKTSVVAGKLVEKAEAVPPPPPPREGFEARVTGDYRANFRAQQTGITPGAGLVINGTAPRGIGTITVDFVLQNVAEGTSTVSLTDGGLTVFQAPATFIRYSNGTGTATVTRNNTDGFAFGTFTFTATNDDDSSKTVTITGEFSGDF